jgi:signal transduction histidine kinase
MRLLRSSFIWLAIGAAAILALEFTHPLALKAPTLRAALETCMTLFGLASAFLLREQVIRTRRRRALLLLAALLILASTEFFANALPAALHARLHSGFTAALPLGQLIAAALLAAAALTSSDKLIRGHNRPVAWGCLVGLGTVGVSELAGLLLRNQLLADPTSTGLGADVAVRYPLGFVVLFITVVAFALAAIEFDHRGRIERAKLLSLLSGAALLFAAARLYHLAMPAVSPEVVTLREGLRLVAFGLIFVALLRRDLEERSRMTRAAAISERHRVAEDLHDGLAQDLALIAAHGARMAKELGADHPVVVAARRALALSRGTIGELSDARSTSDREALEVVAHELGNRFSIEVIVDVQLEDELPPEARTQLVRIVREAIANAARHGGARHVIVTLKHAGSGAALRVCDDGTGIDDASGATSSSGFGMNSMRDRARTLSGSFAASSGRDGGTEVEVVFPTWVRSSS